MQEQLLPPGERLEVILLLDWMRQIRKRFELALGLNIRKLDATLRITPESAVEYEIPKKGRIIDCVEKDGSMFQRVALDIWFHFSCNVTNS